MLRAALDWYFGFDSDERLWVAAVWLAAVPLIVVPCAIADLETLWGRDA